MDDARPRWLVIPAAIGLLLLLLPLAGLLQQADWAGLPSALAGEEARTALWLSIECSLAALVISFLVGVPLAWVLARARFPGRGVLRALVVLPMVLPPVVGGVALSAAFGRAAPLGRLLGDVGITIPFTTSAAILAETFVAMPFLVLTVEAGLHSAGTSAEAVAATLGAGPWRRFRTVTLPLLGPTLAAGGALAWARALGEFGATITFAGNLPGSTQTMPLAVYLRLEGAGDLSGAVALSLALVALSFAVLVALRGRWLGAVAASARGSR